MLCYSYEAMEFDIDTLGWFKTININSVVDRENSKQLCIPLLYEHIIPGTDNRFMLEFYDTQFVTLRDVKTGSRQIIIQGSPNSSEKFPCALFLESGEGYELHFCTSKREKGTIIHSWYRWYLGKDFFQILKKFDRLPLEMDIEKLMDTMKHKDQLELA